MANEAEGDEEFTTVVNQLQKVHYSGLAELRRKCSEQVQINHILEEEVQKLKDKVKELKSVVKCSKIKIHQQAQVISEQSILLRKGKCPPPFHLSNSDYLSSHPADSNPFPESDQFLLPPVAARMDVSTPDNAKTTSRPQAQHMLYSHARNFGKTAFKNTKTDNSCKSSKILSLKLVPSPQVKRLQRIELEPVGNGRVSESSSDSENTHDSGEVSPSFLSDAADVSIIGASKDNPLEIDDPMSCSMFSTYVQTSAAEAEHASQPSPAISTRKRKKNVDEIALKLNSSKRAKDQSVERSPAEPNVLPVTPGVKIKVESIHQKDPTVVPVTPGARTVEDILGSHRAGAAGSLRNGTSGQNVFSKRTTGKTDRPSKTAATFVSAKDPVRKSTRVAGNTKVALLDGNEAAMKLAKREGLPTEYKCETKILKKADRDKLDAKPCPDCEQWYEDGHRDKRSHLRHTCRHKHLHLPSDSDARMWDISFPNTEEYDHRNN